MSEPLKNIFSREMVEDLADILKEKRPDFDRRSFLTLTMKNFDSLELKERIERIAASLGEFLKGEFRENVELLLGVKDRFNPFQGLIFPAYAALKGLNGKDFDVAMKYLAEFTIGSSSEFGVRPFIAADPDRAMRHVAKWAQSGKTDLRRLASEGIRPRLPWGGSLKVFIEDPQPVLKILETLIQDPELYVRKSVANNLNDISKDHPETVISFMKKHYGKNSLTDWILNKGARSLVKANNMEALKILGYAGKKDSGPAVESVDFRISGGKIKIGESIRIKYDVKMASENKTKTRFSYKLVYPTKSGKKGSKIFFLKETSFTGGIRITAERLISFRNLSTRKQVPGVHEIFFLINGQSFKSRKFTLV
jgi:3-methyladenine DNA glycosylase AlkC